MYTSTNKIIGAYIVDLNQRLGKVDYGEVYLGKHLDTQQLVAIKMMPSQKNGQSREIINKVVSIMQQLNHPNLVKILAYYETVNNLYVIMEYCDGGTLSEYIQKQCKQPDLKYLAESEARNIFKQIISGYKEMYDKNIVHRDLKPTNILIHRGVVKITDFGFGKILHNYENKILNAFTGSPLYMSPQILYNKQYTTKADIWSLGIIFYEILFGSPPWNVQTMEQLMVCVKQKKSVFPKYPMVSQEMKDILSKMIEFEEKDRMGWDELFNLQLVFDQKNVDFIRQSIIQIKNGPDQFKKNLLMNNFVQNPQQVQQQLEEIQQQDKEILKQYDNSNSPERVANAFTSAQSQNFGKEKIFEQRKQSVSPIRITLSPNQIISKFSEADEDQYKDQLNRNLIYEIQVWITHKRNKAIVLNYLTQQMFEWLSEGKLPSDKDMYNIICFIISKYQLLILYKTLTRLQKKHIDGTTKRYTEEQWEIFCQSQYYKNALNMIQNEYLIMRLFVKEQILVAQKSIDNLNIPQFQDALKVCNMSFQEKKEFNSIFEQIISFYFTLTKQTVQLDNLTIEQLQFIYNLKNCVNVHKIFKFKKVDFFKYHDDMKNYSRDQLITKILE